MGTIARRDYRVEVLEGRGMVEAILPAVQGWQLLEGRMRGHEDVLLKLYHETAVLRERLNRMNLWLYLQHDGISPERPGISRKRAQQIVDGEG